jgi:hypothetical protein
MKKKGIKGTPVDGPVTEHPFFGRNQWTTVNHICQGVLGHKSLLRKEWRRMHLHLYKVGGEDL